MKTVNEYNENDLHHSVINAEKIILSAIDNLYDDVKEDKTITYEDVHYIKKCLKSLCIIQDIKHI